MKSAFPYLTLVLVFTMSACYEIEERFSTEDISKVLTIIAPRTLNLIANNKDTVSFRIRRVDTSQDKVRITIKPRGIKVKSPSNLDNIEISPGGSVDVVIEADTLVGDADIRIISSDLSLYTGELGQQKFTKAPSLIKSIALSSSSPFFDTSNITNVYRVVASCAVDSISDGRWISSGQLLRFRAVTSKSDSSSIIGRLLPDIAQAAAAPLSKVSFDFVRRPQDRALPSTIYIYAYTSDNRISSTPFEVYLRK
jgi:hypothetical protein